MICDIWIPARVKGNVYKDGSESKLSTALLKLFFSTIIEPMPMPSIALKIRDDKVGCSKRKSKLPRKGT